MSDERESDQIVQRRANFEALAKLGISPYPNAFERTHTVSEIVAGYGAKSGDELGAERVDVKAAGRILAIRSFGKANFLAISDGESRLQVYIRQDALSERDFGLFKLLDLGDFVGVEGYLFRTRTNELTIHATRLEFLSGKDFLEGQRDRATLLLRRPTGVSRTRAVRRSRGPS